MIYGFSVSSGSTAIDPRKNLTVLTSVAIGKIMKDRLCTIDLLRPITTLCRRHLA